LTFFITISVISEDLSVTDMGLPENEGLETRIAFRLHSPAAKVIGIPRGEKIEASKYLHVADAMSAQETFSRPFEVRNLPEAVRKFLRYRYSQPIRKPAPPRLTRLSLPHAAKIIMKAKDYCLRVRIRKVTKRIRQGRFCPPPLFFGGLDSVFSVSSLAPVSS
jgi:hypothetical protein